MYIIRDYSSLKTGKTPRGEDGSLGRSRHRMLDAAYG